MLKALEVDNKDSCFNRATDNEWLFVLLGRDIAAPATIRFWIKERIRLGKNNAGDAQTQEALRCANSMEGLEPGMPPALAEAAPAETFDAQRMVYQYTDREPGENGYVAAKELAEACYAAGRAAPALEGQREAQFVDGVKAAAQFLEDQALAEFMPNEPMQVLLKGLAMSVRALTRELRPRGKKMTIVYVVTSHHAGSGKTSYHLRSVFWTEQEAKDFIANQAQYPGPLVYQVRKFQEVLEPRPQGDENA